MLFHLKIRIKCSEKRQTNKTIVFCWRVTGVGCVLFAKNDLAPRICVPQKNGWGRKRVTLFVTVYLLYHLELVRKQILEELSVRRYKNSNS